MSVCVCACVRVRPCVRVSVYSRMYYAWVRTSVCFERRRCILCAVYVCINCVHVCSCARAACVFVCGMTPHTEMARGRHVSYRRGEAQILRFAHPPCSPSVPHMPTHMYTPAHARTHARSPHMHTHIHPPLKYTHGRTCALAHLHARAHGGAHTRAQPRSYVHVHDHV